ncbi:MAG: hypothetical protein IPG74_12645 [Flavobacteriales bacterium]|nr:hypothetical protein [Flavobacteriales bacterium]
MLKAIDFRRGTILLGHCVFVALLVLAWQHAELRMTNGDTANQFFGWLNYDDLNVEAYRYSAIVPQLVVKGMLLTGSDLLAMVVAGSVTHVLVGYAIFMLCAHFWRADASALATALAAVLCSRLSFYGPALEANYLLCYPFLCFGYLECNSGSLLRTTAKSIAAIGLALPALIVHPMGGVVLSCCAIAMWQVHALSGRKCALVVLSAIAWFVLSKLVFPPTGYETEQYEKLLSGLTDLPNAAGWHSVEFLLGHTWHDTAAYLPVWIIAGALACMLWRLAGPCSSIVVTGLVIGFIMLNLITFHSGDTAIMLDRSILPLATMIALPFCVLLFRMTGTPRTLVLSLLLLVIFLKFRDVSFASRQFAERYIAIEQVLGTMKEAGIVNAIVADGDLEDVGLVGSWALPCETMLVSTIHEPDSTGSSFPLIWRDRSGVCAQGSFHFGSDILVR